MDIDSASVPGKGRKGGGHHYRRDIFEFDLGDPVIADMNPHSFQHIHDRADGEFGVGCIIPVPFNPTTNPYPTN